MTTSTNAGQARLAVIKALHSKIQATYEKPVSLSTLAQEAGMPSTKFVQMAEWLNHATIPQESSFQEAQERLEALLHARMLKVASSHLKLPRSVRRTVRTRTMVLAVIAAGMGGAFGALLSVYFLL